MIQGDKIYRTNQIDKIIHLRSTPQNNNENSVPKELQQQVQLKILNSATEDCATEDWNYSSK